MSLRLEVFGVEVAVRLDDDQLLQPVRAALPGSAESASAAGADACLRVSCGERGYGVHLEGELLEVTPYLDAAMRRLASEVHFQVARHARSVVFVHAGVVGLGGRAIVVPGRSHSGKTSLVLALARAGADYYSDEYAVVDAEGVVHPYVKPLSIRGSEGRGCSVTADALDLRPGAAPLRPGLIVSTRYVANGDYTPRRVRPARGLIHLIDNTIVVRERPGFALACLTPLAQGARTLEGDRGEADRAADALLRALDDGGDDAAIR